MLSKYKILLYSINNEEKTVLQNWQDTVLYNINFWENLYFEATMVLRYTFSGSGGYWNNDYLQLNTTKIHTWGGNSWTWTYNSAWKSSTFNLFWHAENTYGYTYYVKTTLRAYYEHNKKKSIPTSVKSIGEKATVILYGRLPNNVWYIDETDFTDSDKIEYCKKNGASHTINKTNYTATGYGYIVYTGGSGSNVAQITINGNIVAYCNSSYMSGIQFFKPGDNIVVSNLTSIKWYDFY